MIVGVLLAAGTSSRFGEYKLLAPLAGKPLVRLVAEQLLASALDRLVVVIGREAEAVREALADLPIDLVYNPSYAEGMSSSLRRGVAALPAGAEGTLIGLADQPLPSPAIIDDLIRAFRRSRKPIAAPRYAGRRGNPVLFAAALFPELLEIAGDQGAREVLERRMKEIELVDYPFPAPPDIDTPEDYARVAATFVE